MNNLVIVSHPDKNPSATTEYFKQSKMRLMEQKKI